MGLDIYLTRYENFEDTIKREEEYQKYSTELWEAQGDKKYEDYTEEEKDEIRKKEEAFAKKLNLDKWGTDETNVKRVEFDSEKYPDHYFKVGYFRSSYNGSGINRILRNFGLPTLDEMFEVVEEEYYIQPDWEKVVETLKRGLEEFKKKGQYRVRSVSNNIFSDRVLPSNEKDALDVFFEEIDKNKSSDFEGGYSNICGDFYLDDGLKVFGLIPGKEEFFGDRDCLYVVTEGDNDWYYHAFEIMIDTCEYVLKQKDKEKYYLRWSG